jgi:uncharacterized protein
MDRIFEAMGIMNKYIEGIEDKTDVDFEDSQLGTMLHIYGTAYIAAAIAAARNLDPKLAFVIGLMHDTGKIDRTIYDGGHGQKGAEIVSKLLGNTGKFTQDEIDVIFLAIQNHSNKKDIGTEYEEVIKDADVVERIFLMKDKCENSKKKRKRLKTTLHQLGVKFYKKNNECSQS